MAKRSGTTAALPTSISLILALSCGWASAAAPKNVIIFIGDGMGSEQIEAAGYFFNGASGSFSFEQLGHPAWMTTNLSNGGLTDSAASATAIATGLKVNSGVVSVALADGPDPRSAFPSDGRPLQTMLELFKGQGKSTGLVTNSLMVDATPAGFGAHAPDRSAISVIANGLLNGSRPTVLLGGGGSGFTPTNATNAGYQVVTSRSQLQAVDPTSVGRVAGMFGTSQFPFAFDQSVGSTSFYDTNPFLDEMTDAALSVLAQNPNGFFLMVENELTDAGGHLPVDDPHKAIRTIFEVREMSRAVQKAIDFSVANPDTLIIVTADHETGGFVTTQNNGIGVLPDVTSGDTRHNATMVPVYAAGPNAGHAFGHLDNTDLLGIVTTSAPAPDRSNVRRSSFQQGVAGYAGTLDAQLSSDNPTATNQASPAINVSTTDSSQAVIRFDGLTGQTAIPEGAEILAAKLSLFTGNESGDGTARNLSLHRLLVPIDENTTFDNAGNLPGNGLSLNQPGTADDDYLATAEFVFPAPSRNAVVTFDVTDSLIQWFNLSTEGQADLGWVIFASGSDNWRFNSAEAGVAALRPLLEVTYAIPEPAGAIVLASLMGFLGRRRSP